jgi:iron complex outermembrane receptor protein
MIGFGSSVPAQAQLEEVIVTAQKRAESLQDVPVTVQAFSNEALTDFGISNTQDLQIVTPGLIINNTGASAQAYLRGVGTRFAFAGLEPSVATYLDDRYLSRAQASVFELADVERVEVLKGPQGILYGRNATGGAIRVVTLDVVDEFEGNLKATAGNYNQVGLSGTVNVPISDTFGMRLSAVMRERDGYADNLDPRGRDEFDDQDYQSYRAKLRWDMSENITARLTVDYNDRDDNSGNDVVDLSPPGLSVGIALGGISGKDVDEVATAMDTTTDSEDWSASLRFDVALDALDFASITTYWDMEQNANTDADGTSIRLIDDPYALQKVDSFSQEFQFVSNTDGNLNWIAGLYYFQENNDQFEIVLDLTENPNAGIYASQGNQAVETTAYAAFGQASYAFTDSWSVTLGGRYSYEEKDVEISRFSEPAVVSLVRWPYEDSNNWSEFTPKASLEYNFDAGMVYLTYSRGFKSGGFNYAASLQNPITGEPTPVLDPEILDMIELGWKTELLERRLRLNGALYYYDYKDLQVTRALADPNTGASVNLTQNAADAKIMGLDLDATWMVTNALTVTLGLNILDSEYQDYDAPANVFNASLTGQQVPGMSPVVFDADGESLLRASDYSYFVSANYEFSVGDARLPLVVSYSYKDDYNFDFVADPLSDRLRQEGFGLLSARLTYIDPSENWEFALWGKNLTDEDDYFDDIVGNGTGIRGSHGSPRTYGVDVSYSF